MQKLFVTLVMCIIRVTLVMCIIHVTLVMCIIYVTLVMCIIRVTLVMCIIHVTLVHGNLLKSYVRYMMILFMIYIIIFVHYHCNNIIVHAADDDTSSKIYHGTLLYELKINDSENKVKNFSSVGIHAGDDVVLVAREYCDHYRLDEQACTGIVDYLCTETKLKCRSKSSVLEDPIVIGSARVNWIGTSPLIDSDNKKECAIGMRLLRSDAQRTIQVGIDDTNRLGKQNIEYIDSLISFHCSNMVSYHLECFCTHQVKEALASGLMKELDRFRWSKSSNYYLRLGIKKESSLPEIKKAYRKLSLQYHPDRNSENVDLANERIILLNEAYETLSNEEAKFQHDKKHFGTQFVSEHFLPNFKVQVNSVFGKGAGVTIDQQGNIKIVL